MSKRIKVLLVSSDLFIIDDRVIRPTPPLPADTLSLGEAFEALGWEVTVSRSRESLLGDQFLGCKYSVIVVPFFLGNVDELPTKLVFSFGILFEIFINIYRLHKKPS